MVSMAGTIATISTALLLAILAGCLVRRQIRLMLALLGLIAGYSAGSLLFAMVSGMTGGSLNAVWVFWLLACTTAVVGCVLALYLGQPLVKVSTALVGSYLFMRSWTLFFPGSYPSEEALIQSKGHEALEMDALFWMYVGIFIVSFTISLTYQCKTEDDDEKEQEEYYTEINHA